MVNWTNITNASQFLQAPNTETGGWFWVGILGMIWTVLFMSLLQFGTYPALLAASFAAVVIGIFFVYMSLVGFQWIVLIIAGMIAVFFWIGYSSSRYNQ